MEIAKLLPKAEERKKYIKRPMPQQESQQVSKKPRLEKEPEVDTDTYEKQQKKALELNEKYVTENLTMEKVVHFVVTGLNSIPATMPAQFVTEYGKQVKAGQVGQLKMIAKLMAAQFLEAGVGPGAKVITKSPPVVEKLIDETCIKVEPVDSKEVKDKVCRNLFCSMEGVLKKRSKQIRNAQNRKAFFLINFCN